MRHNQYVFRPNTLYQGDCLDVMKRWESDCVDLIYLDPPFNSNANYNIIYGKDQKGRPLDERAQFIAFGDTWYWGDEAAERVRSMKNAIGHPAHRAICGLSEMLPEGGMLAYLSYMAERLAQMKRVLKITGSIYLHCDPTASHYLKTVMDCVFGVDNFRNEIVWSYHKMPNKIKGFQKNHDVILFYTNGGEHTFNRQYEDYTESSKNTYLRAEKVGYNINYKKGMATVWDWDKYNKAIKSGAIRDGAKLKPVAFSGKGSPMRAVWDLPILAPSAKERLGYPTQKPLALLERIVNASSNASDIVLDPFCGCGTTAEAAYKLGRKLIGIDISPYAITRICNERLKHAEGIFMRGLPTDMDGARKLAKADHDLFEQWAVTTLPGFEPNEKQTRDGGVDGRGLLLHPPEGESKICVAQIKGGGYTPDSLRALLSKITGGHASIGIFVTLEKMGDTPTKRECIANAGKLQEGAKTFDRYLFWSMEEHFAGRKLHLPAMAHPRTGKAMQDAIPTA